jgi:hypothetical protein
MRGAKNADLLTGRVSRFDFPSDDGKEHLYYNLCSIGKSIVTHHETASQAASVPALCVDLFGLPRTSTADHDEMMRMTAMTQTSPALSKDLHMLAVPFVVAGRNPPTQRLSARMRVTSLQVSTHLMSSFDVLKHRRQESQMIWPSRRISRIRGPMASRMRCIAL